LKNLKIACDLSTPSPYTPPEGMVYRCVGSNYVDILKKYNLDSKWNIRLDLLYHAPRWDYMQLLYLWDWTDKKDYVSEYGDCDDSGIIFKGHMAEFALINGIMWVIDWSGSHSYNLLFDIQLKEGSTDPMNPIVDIVKSKAIVLEPQSDEWEEVPLVVAGDYVPSFPKWQEMRKVAGLTSGMYPLKDCALIM
jgi:hypothetical protein